MKRTKQRIDWQRVHEQLAANRNALDDVFLLESRRMDVLLKDRAEQLANRFLENDHDDQSYRHVLTFTLDKHRFAIDLNSVSKVARLNRVTPVPGGPPELSGIANFEGEIRSVVDLRPLLGVPHVEAAPIAYAILLCGEQTELAIGADHIDEITHYRADKIHTSDDATLHMTCGIGPDGVALIDVTTLFTELDAAASPMVQHYLHQG
jgi:purine-binding chemotaxis protein CheW